MTRRYKRMSPSESRFWRRHGHIGVCGRWHSGRHEWTRKRWKQEWKRAIRVSAQRVAWDIDARLIAEIYGESPAKSATVPPMEIDPSLNMSIAWTF